MAPTNVSAFAEHHCAKLELKVYPQPKDRLPQTGEMREGAQDRVHALVRNGRAGIPTDTVSLPASPSSATSAEFAKHVESLARKIAGRGADAVSLEVARVVARAEFDLAQIRRVRVALIARMAEFGRVRSTRPASELSWRHSLSDFNRSGPTLRFVSTDAAKHAFFRTGALS